MSVLPVNFSFGSPVPDCVQMGQQCLADPANGITFAHFLFTVNISQGKKEETVSLLK